MSEPKNTTDSNKAQLQNISSASCFSSFLLAKPLLFLIIFLKSILSGIFQTAAQRFLYAAKGERKISVRLSSSNMVILDFHL